MNVNDIFTQIGNFWDRISVPILFHIIFFFLFIFIFGKFSIKTSLEKYIQSDSFKRTKTILTEFELWKKLPIILIILTLIYLTLFNSVTGFVGSVRIIPFKISYSNEDFLKEYEPKENIIEFAKYNKDTVINLFKVNQLKEKFLEEYKGHYPEMYDNWVKWPKDQLVKQHRYLNLTVLTINVLLIILIIRFFQKNRTKKFLSLFKFLLVLILSLPILFLLRYKVEQSIELRFSNKIMFVKSSLETDISKHIVLDTTQIDTVEKILNNELINCRIYPRHFWISRIVGQSEILQNIIGTRILQNIDGRNDGDFE